MANPTAEPPALGLLSAYRPHHHWHFTPSPIPTYSRQLGLLENKFDLASQDLGQSDTFLQIALVPDSAAASPGRQDAFLARLPLAWARLRALHPALGCRVESYVIEEDGEAVSEWRRLRLPGRRFVYAPPRGEQEAIEEAMASLLVEPSGGKGAGEVVDDYALNGERCLIGFGCLARLLAFPAEDGGCELVLVISHTISDGLSVLNLVAELLRLVSDATLPTPPGPPPAFLSVSDFLAGQPPPNVPAFPAEINTHWKILVAPSDIISLLAPASEDLYPTLPISPTPLTDTVATAPVPPLSDQPASLATHPQPDASSSSASRARQRWTWAIARTRVDLDNARFPTSPRFPRLPPHSPPVQAHTRWAVLRLPRPTSAALVALSKANGLSPSMLLFALLGLATAALLEPDALEADAREVVFGFPFSLRPCLTGDAGMDGAASRDTAIRIGFDSIWLPGGPPPLAGTDPARTRSLALRHARLAKRQFARRLAKEPAARTQLMAAQYLLILDRMLKGLGTNPAQLKGPASALNASMIGDVDRILPARVAVPSAADAGGGVDAEVFGVEGLVIGTRLHRNEGMLCEAFTFGGQITFCLGWDSHCMARETVEGFLAEAARVAEEVANAGDSDV